jgi:hypothetical protein
MRAPYHGNGYIDEHTFDADDRLRQLVRLRGQRGRVISAAEEERLLEEAVTRLGMSLERARGVLLAEMQRGQIPLESDLEDTVAELLKSFAGSRKKLSRRDFEVIANLHASQRKIQIEAARAMVKRLMEEEDISPRAAGIMRTKRWYRRIKT